MLTSTTFQTGSLTTLPCYFCLLILLNLNAYGHNGAVVFAYPMNEISIDGNLSDWPASLTTYDIQRAELGDLIDGDSDFKAFYRVGYNAELSALYVAVEIKDQSSVVDSTSQANWDTQDGIEIFLDLAHQQSGSMVTQNSYWGNKQLAFGTNASWDHVEMQMATTNEGRVYEWRISFMESIDFGQSIGFDISVSDKDKDGSFTWISWGKGSQKLNNPSRCGDLVFVTNDTKYATINGKLDLSNIPIKVPGLPLRITSIDDAKMWLQISTDSLGYYLAEVPAGAYLLDIPPEMLRVENEYLKIASMDPVKCLLLAGVDNYPPTLTPKQDPQPDLYPAVGILYNFDQEQQAVLNRFIATYQEYYSIPGVSLALIKDGEVIYQKTYGVKNTITQDPVVEGTLFEAASITKPVFAFVVLRLVEKGLIDLDKPLYQYLRFEELEEYPEYRQMTARHVLTHRSGLPNWGRKMENTPGEKYGYSGEGFEYLKRAVVEITGKDIETVLDQELIIPLELYHMEFSDSEELRKVVSSGHLGNQPTNWGIPQEPGMAFSMHTEAKAFAKFAIALLERKGLKPETYHEFFTIVTDSPEEHWSNENQREGAGLGIFIRESAYGDTFTHGGNNGDFKCLFEVYQDLKMGYVIFTNSDMGDKLAADMANLLVEGKAVSD